MPVRSMPQAPAAPDRRVGQEATHLRRRLAARSRGPSPDIAFSRRRVRRKLEPNPKTPQYIVTVHGLGYKFVG